MEEYRGRPLQNRNLVLLRIRISLDGCFTRRRGRRSTRHRRLLSRWRAGRDTCWCWRYLRDSNWLRVESSSPPADAVRFVLLLWPNGNSTEKAWSPPVQTLHYPHDRRDKIDASKGRVQQHDSEDGESQLL